MNATAEQEKGEVSTKVSSGCGCAGCLFEVICFVLLCYIVGCDWARDAIVRCVRDAKTIYREVK